MGRIITPVTITNARQLEFHILCDALVDTGASHMVLPSGWKSKLGDIEHVETVELELADQSPQSGEICGPVKIQIEGFRPIYSEVLFLDMRPAEGRYEPLVGYLVLEQSQAAVDMLGHRLVHVKRLDLKGCDAKGCAIGKWQRDGETSPGIASDPKRVGTD
jgi:predicted aspartyl protease